MLKCDLFLVLKKYVPGITHQLCTVANWNPQLSKDLLNVGNFPTKALKKQNNTSQLLEGVVLPPLFEPCCPPAESPPPIIIKAPPQNICVSSLDDV